MDLLLNNETAARAGIFKRLIAKTGGLLARLKAASSASCEASAAKFPDINDYRGASTVEDALSRVFDLLPDVVAVRRISDGRFRYVNAAFTHVHGWTRAEALSRTVDELEVWADPAERVEFFREFNSRGQISNFVISSRVRRNTAVEPMLASAVRVDVEGEPHLVSVLRNVAAIRSAEERARESEDRLRAIFDAGLDLVVVIRMSDERYVYVNSEFTRVTGYSAEMTVGRTVAEVAIWPDLENHGKYLDEVKERGISRNSEQVMRKRDGTLVPILISAVTVELDGELHRVSMGRDITAIKQTEAELVEARERLSHQLDEMRTSQWMLRAAIIEREQAENRLRQNETKLRKVFDASLDAVSIRRLRDERIIDVNIELMRLTGYSHEEAMATGPGAPELWQDPSARKLFLRQLRAIGEVRNFEANIRRKDGVILPAMVSGATIELEGEACAVIVVRDYSRFKKAQMELVSAQDELAAQVEALRESQRQLRAEVAERHEAETRARAGERNLRQVFDTSLVSFSINRIKDMAFIEANREFFELFDFKREEVIGKNAFQLGIWPQPEEYQVFHQRLLEDGTVRDFLGSFRNKTGGWMTILLSAVTIEHAGEPCFAVMGRDITDLKSKERELLAVREALSSQVEALRQSEARLQTEIEERAHIERNLRESEAKQRKIFDTSLDSISMRKFDDNRYLDANPAFLSLTGYSREEVIGHSMSELNLRADNFDNVFRDRMLEYGFVQNMEGLLRRKDGSIVPIMASAVTIELGGQRSVVAVTRDITSIKKAEERRHESEHRLRQIFDANLDAIAVRSMKDGVYREVNQEFLKLTGYSREEVIGRSRDELNLWARESKTSHDSLMAAEGQIQNVEESLRRKDGTFVSVMTSAVRIDLDGEPCLLGITRDITRSKQAERELLAAHEAALAASRAKSDFLSTMSHEIRTPMNAILGMADVLSETRLDAAQRRYVETMRTNGDTLLLLIDDILDLAKVESGHLTLEHLSFDLGEMVERTIETFAPRVREKGLKLSWSVAPDLPRKCVGDPLRLRQILNNLISNALKFTEHGAVAMHVDRDPKHSASTSSTHMWVRFSISDTGIGIDPDGVESIFESFTQADSSISRRYGGSGLGLAIVKRLVDLYEGTIVVNSAPGRGSTFIVTLRLQLADDAVRPRPSVESAAGHGNGARVVPALDVRPRRILLAEDSADNRLLIRAYLQALPYQIDEAADGETAIVRFMAGEYDAVLMDIQMPVMDGYAAARSIRQWEQREGRAPTPIIALTASALDEAVRRSLEAGCNSHLSKPVRKATLVKALEQALAAVPAHSAYPGGENGGYAGKENGSRAEEGPPSTLRANVRADLQPLIGKFLEHKRADLEQLNAALETSDFATIAWLGHRLRGEGGSYGLDRISEIGAQLEVAAMGGDRDGAGLLRDALTDYLARVEIVYV